MSDTVKMFIEIPTEQYNRIVKAPRCVDFNKAVEDRTILIRALREGTSLDSVKAEIKRMEYHMIDCDVLVSQEEVLEILDNIDKSKE